MENTSLGACYKTDFVLNLEMRPIKAQQCSYLVLFHKMEFDHDPSWIISLRGFLRDPGKAFGSGGPGQTQEFPLFLSWVSAGCSSDTGWHPQTVESCCPGLHVSSHLTC